MTDHYSDAREAYEEGLLKERAKWAKRSIEDQREYEDIFLPAKKLAEQHEKLRKATETYNRLSWKYGS